MDGESGELTVRRSGKSKNRKDRDRGAEMRLTERTRKLGLGPGDFVLDGDPGI